MPLSRLCYILFKSLCAMAAAPDILAEEPGMVLQACNPGMWQVKAGRAGQH